MLTETIICSCISATYDVCSDSVNDYGYGGVHYISIYTGIFLFFYNAACSSYNHDLVTFFTIKV